MRIKIILLMAIFTCFPMLDAYAYIDPGTGSIVFQAIIGALVGVGITLKIYWIKIKEKLFLRNNDK
jgi:hypothetical protein